MHTNGIINHRTLYRLPWNLADNAISWLEPTSQCNLSCDGCYRENINDSHKPLDIIKEEIEIFHRLRNADGVSIAGGDPLVHPDIIEIVRMVSTKGLKPIINTNGNPLTKELLRELKKAGVYGFTFHIDSKQGRPKWKNKNEIELNELRLYYAEMLADVGGISCAFNSTVYEDTKQYTTDLIEWAGKHIDIVQVMVFIIFRQAVPNLPFKWFVGEQEVDVNKLVYGDETPRQVEVKSHELVEEIRKRIPDFTPCAYLNGTEKPDSFKWLLSGRVGTKEKIYGYVGPKFMEIVQAGHHLLKGRYLAYSKPSMTRKGRSMLFLSLFDSSMRHIAGRYFTSILTNPARLFKGLHYQTVLVIQPIDVLPNGLQNMCDGCPDMTVYNGELVWSCRMEELKHFGNWMRTVPRDRSENVVDV